MCLKLLERDVNGIVYFSFIVREDILFSHSLCSIMYRLTISSDVNLVQNIFLSPLQNSLL